MHPLFALLLPVWWSMHYIFNCSSYLKYRIRISSVWLVTNSICSTFFFEIIETQPLLVLLYSLYKIHNNWCTLIVAQIIAYTVVIYGHWTLEVRPGVRVASLVIFRIILKYSWSFVYTCAMPRNPYRFIYTSTYCFKLLPHCVWVYWCLRLMQRYFNHICDGTDVKADWRLSCTYDRNRPVNLRKNWQIWELIATFCFFSSLQYLGCPV